MPVYTKQFQKDVKLAGKRKKDLDKLKNAIEMLLKGDQMPAKYRNHWLTRNYANRQECHLEPGWLLIYRFKNKEIIFERTGTHADLFK